MNHHKPDRCEIKVKPEDIINYRYDTWVFARGGGRSMDNHWNVCMYRKKYRTVRHFSGYTQACSRCRNDYFDALEICHAEEGTKIVLYDASEADYRDDGVSIEMLKDFESKDCENPLKIEGLQQSVTTDDYKMIYSKMTKRGSLNREVSSVDVFFTKR